jgi:hypothetical protein
MRPGLIIDFNHKGHKKWVVVNVNECRAYIVPLANRDPEEVGILRRWRLFVVVIVVVVAVGRKERKSAGIL